MRALLASDEFVEATTQSLFALNGEALGGAPREEVREQVAQNAARIDAALELLHPGAHRVYLAHLYKDRSVGPKTDSQI